MKLSDKQLAKMLPKGELAKLDHDRAVVVFPVAFKHLSRFSTQITSVLQKLAGVEVSRSASAEQKRATLVLAAIPLIAQELLGLIEATTVTGVVDERDKFHMVPEGDEAHEAIADLPHWELPEVVEKWFDLSFGQPRKYRPWLAVAEKAIAKLTGQKISISEMFSKHLSSQDTAATTSSSADKPATEQA